MSSLAVTIIGGIAFFALILVSVGLHEVGHFVPGKLFKVRILQFFIGFGKTLWKTNKGETEYGVKMVPLGGYVRLLGMYPPFKEGKDTRLKRIADSAREGEWEEITDDDVAGKRLYFQKPIWQRLIIMFSGVLMNLILAFGLFLGVNLTYGNYVQGMSIATVVQCDDPAAEVCEITPAYSMGLQVGDKVVAFNGTAYSTWTDLTAAVRANEDNPVQLTVIRDGARVDLPQVHGMIHTVADPNDASQTIQAGYLGVTSAYENVKIGPVGTLGQMWSITKVAVGAIVKLPVTATTILVDMITGQPRDPNGPMSIVGASVIAGDAASMQGIPTSTRVAFWAQLLGQINLFVALLNLVPLPPFDGGHVAAALYEGIRRVLSKLGLCSDPGAADTAKLLPLTYVVGGLLLLIGVILILADIISPVNIF
ncbi:MAG: site-2 protease family protein [Propionibacteriaceae bacterium]|nr:site-2 protease family protein [Propionibacteriaceae bacterium]